MERLDMQSMDKVDENVRRIGAMFPNCVVERKNEAGQVELAIDFDLLRQELSRVVVEGPQERYQFTWPDKRKAILAANAPISDTLRPCREESVDFDTTQNLYIEGDNLAVLKLLQETYMGKVKMIYIDPPYNTGHDFVYNDSFAMDGDDFADRSGMYDEQGNLLFDMHPNGESNGRYHTDWLNMLYPRLKLSRDLLTEDGIIFISIDDNEVTNLKKICDEIFGISSFVAQIVIEGTPKNDPKIISTAHEYCLVYVKNYEVAKEKNWGIRNPIYDDLLEIVSTAPTFEIAERRVRQYYKDHDLADDNISNYNRVDGRGLFRIGPLDDPQGGGPKDVRYNPVTGEMLKTPNRGWGCSLSTWNEWVKNGEVLFPSDNTKLCSRKVYIEKGKLDLLRAYFKMQIRKDTDMLKNMFGSKVFSFPKPVDFIKALIDSSTNDNDIVLDFFSGSATTAHAVMQLNLERLKTQSSSKQLQFILVQLPENLEENLRHATGNREKQTCQNAINYCLQHGYQTTLTSIGKERIRLAGMQIAGSDGLFGMMVDVGFRVLKLASSNMQDVFYTPDQYTFDLLASLEGNIKPDRTPEDLLFQVMLDLGVLLSSKIEVTTIAGKRVFNVADGYLMACFDEDVTEEVVTAIAKQKPYYFVMRDSSMASDSVATNFEQLFITYSPDTVRRVL